MFAIAVTYVIAPGHEEEAADSFRACMHASRKERGNQRYHVYRSQDEPRRFFLFEEYDDEQAFEEHRNSAHFDLHIRNGVMKIMESRSADRCTPLDLG